MAIATKGAVAAHAAPTRGARLRRLVILFSALTFATTMAFAETTVVAAHGTASASGEAQPAKGSQAALVIKLARQALGHPFRIGTEGPNFFDCSGLVWSVFKRAGLVSRIGGARRGATGYLHWAQRTGRASRRNLQVGDVLLWGDHGRARHSGIYIGNGRAISALNPKLGVRDWPVRWIHMRIIGIVHTGLTH